jgi:hypothetical protein
MSFKAQPAQIRASGTTAHGSYRGFDIARSRLFVILACLTIEQQDAC